MIGAKEPLLHLILLASATNGDKRRAIIWGKTLQLPLLSPNIYAVDLRTKPEKPETGAQRAVKSATLATYRIVLQKTTHYFVAELHKTTLTRATYVISCCIYTQ